MQMLSLVGVNTRLGQDVYGLMLYDIGVVS